MSDIRYKGQLDNELVMAATEIVLKGDSVEIDRAMRAEYGRFVERR